MREESRGIASRYSVFAANIVYWSFSIMTASWFEPRNDDASCLGRNQGSPF
jgi:hypothetical protein